MDENVSFDQQTLNTFWTKAESAENIPSELIIKLKSISNLENVTSTEIIGLIKEVSGEHDA